MVLTTPVEMQAYSPHKNAHALVHARLCNNAEVSLPWKLMQTYLVRISIPKSVATGAMYGTGTTRRQEGAKADAAKRKRDAGLDILNPQIRALEAMDEALDTDHNAKHNTKASARTGGGWGGLLPR